MVALETDVCNFGWKARPFSLPSVDGGQVSLDDVVARGGRGLLVMFICNHCPYVRAVIDRIVRDARELAGMGVGVVAICSNDPGISPGDSFPAMKEFARIHGFSFPYLHDSGQEVARAWGAVCTPDFFGFNARLELQYRGRLDASRETAGPPDLRRELFEAMKQIVETGEGPREQVPSIGCSIKWRDA